MGAVRIRTDVERKRLHGLRPDARSGSALNAGLYSAAQTERTYTAIAAHARAIVSAGYPVIADGTFLHAGERQRFRALAEELEAPFAIVDFVAPADTLRARVNGGAWRRAMRRSPTCASSTINCRRLKH